MRDWYIGLIPRPKGIRLGTFNFYILMSNYVSAKNLDRQNLVSYQAESTLRPLFRRHYCVSIFFFFFFVIKSAASNYIEGSLIMYNSFARDQGSLKSRWVMNDIPWIKHSTHILLTFFTTSLN